MKKIISILIVLCAIFYMDMIPSTLSALGHKGDYVEFKMTSEKFSGLSKTYYLDGNSRTETTMQMTALPDMHISMTYIMKKDVPDSLFMLNESNKTYYAMKSNFNSSSVAKDDYEITVIGKEKVDNYDCTHVRVLDKTKNITSEIWVSKDVPDYSSLTNIKSKYLAGIKLYKELEAKGVSGFTVRMIASAGTEVQFQMDLVKVKRKDMSNSLFSLAGYTKSSSMPSMFNSK